MKTLSIIGAGRVGKTLARLMHQHKAVHVHQIINQTPASTQAALNWIGSGHAVEHVKALSPVDFLMIATPDSLIEQMAKDMHVKNTTIVFHVSGSLDSSVLSCTGAHTASIHPSFSFADPDVAVKRFSGTVCALEGDDEAKNSLRDIFGKIGADVFDIERQHKIAYHTAAVLACNLMAPLIKDSLTLLESAHINQTQALKILKPLLESTVENMTRLGPANGLTGPLARGDTQTIQHHIALLKQQHPDIYPIYQALSRKAIDLARAKDSKVDDKKINLISDLLAV